MIERLRALPLLGAYRGLPPLAIDALGDLLERLGRVRASFPGESKIHLERILAREDGPVCVEARRILV